MGWCKWVCFVDGKNWSIDGKKKCQPVNGLVYRWEEEERAVDGEMAFTCFCIGNVRMWNVRFISWLKHQVPFLFLHCELRWHYLIGPGNSEKGQKTPLLKWGILAHYLIGPGTSEKGQKTPLLKWGICRNCTHAHSAWGLHTSPPHFFFFVPQDLGQPYMYGFWGSHCHPNPLIKGPQTSSLKIHAQPIRRWIHLDNKGLVNIA